MSTLNTQQVQLGGVVPTLTAAASGGDAYSCGASSFLHVKNGGGSSITVTLVTPGTAFGQPIGDVAVTVGAGVEKLIGPLTPGEFKDPSSGLGSVTYSAVTTVTVGVFSV